MRDWNSYYKLGGEAAVLFKHYICMNDSQSGVGMLADLELHNPSDIVRCAHTCGIWLIQSLSRPKYVGHSGVIESRARLPKRTRLWSPPWPP
jgi:hypothetical protein